jgi:hypothetical protein
LGQSKYQYGYEQFPKETNETTALDKILSDAQKRDSLLSQTDRNPGGMHPNAHLWDNGNDPVNELKNVMKVRSALSQFGQNNIRKAHQWQC